MGKRFDFIFIPFNSIHHLYKNEDLFKVLKIVKKHLQENGIFLLDCFNPNIRYIVHKEKKKDTMAEYTTSNGRKVMIKQTMCYENATQINRIKWHYLVIVKTCSDSFFVRTKQAVRLSLDYYTLLYRWCVSFNPKLRYADVFPKRTGLLFEVIRI